MAESTEHGHEHRGAFAGLHSHDGGALHWHDEFGLHLSEDMSEEEIAARTLDWRMHNTTIVTVGVDIGSSTSHLMFSRIFVQLVGEGSDTRSVVVGREILWKSPIILTPYVDVDTIDVRALRRFISDAYFEVGATGNEVDSGAIITTGEALKRKNSQSITEMAASYAGKFVCAAAGHHLEAVLAANGSGTVARSRRDGQTLMNIDIGGGTTKFALVHDGAIVETAAVAIGARQLVRNEEGSLTRIDEPVRRVAHELGISLTLGEPLAAEDEAKIVETWANILAGLIEQREPEGLAAELMLTDAMVTHMRPQAITFSGGVSEFIFFRETGDFGDLGKALAKAIRSALSDKRITLPALIDPNLGIRATAIGASQFTVQVGLNLYVSDEAVLPLRNVAVLVPRLELEGDVDAGVVAKAIEAAAVRTDFEEGGQPVAVAFKVADALSEASVRAMAQGIRDALPRTIESKQPLVVLVNETVGLGLGKALNDGAGIPGDVVYLEGVTVAEFDFIDVGEVIHPTEVLPITIKSLLFAGGLDRRSVKQALIAAALKSPS